MLKNLMLVTALILTGVAFTAFKTAECTDFCKPEGKWTAP